MFLACCCMMDSGPSCQASTLSWWKWWPKPYVSAMFWVSPWTWCWFMALVHRGETQSVDRLVRRTQSSSWALGRCCLLRPWHFLDISFPEKFILIISYALKRDLNLGVASLRAGESVVEGDNGSYAVMWAGGRLWAGTGFSGDRSGDSPLSFGTWEHW